MPDKYNVFVLSNNTLK